MILCDLCVHYRQGSLCALELKIPKTMSCRDFCPSIQTFCANPKDFVDARQVTDMATFFGLKGTELKKVKLMAASTEESKQIT
jgi:hypothetical protein